jgi:hypothetical protein
MQTYSLTTIGLLVGVLFVGTYAWQGPQDTTLRVALIENAKPLLVNIPATTSSLTMPSTAGNTPERLTAAEADNTPDVVDLEGANSAELSLASLRQLSDLQITEATTAALDDTAVDDVQLDDASATDIEIEPNLEPSLPPEYTGLDWTVDLTAETNISELSFSDAVDDDLNALSPSRLFEEGFFTIYATFDYDQMEDGMTWSWVWRRDGQVINGGHEIWDYGNEGPGYVFLNPQEGFRPGQYVVEVWVNEELMTTANLFVTSDNAANN